MEIIIKKYKRAILLKNITNKTKIRGIDVKILFFISILILYTPKISFNRAIAFQYFF